VVIGVILTRGEVLLGVFAGMERASFGRDRREARREGVVVGE
jgi:hypothetical protein